MKRYQHKELSINHSFQLNDVLIIQNIFYFVCRSPQRGVWKTRKSRIEDSIFRNFMKKASHLSICSKGTLKIMSDVVSNFLPCTNGF